jgi:hypothetical protein
MLTLKSNDTEFYTQQSISLSDIEYLFNDYDNDNLNNFKHDKNPFNDFLSFYANTQSPTKNSNYHSLILANIPSSLIQLTILIFVLLFVFLICKCNKFLNVFRDYRTSNEHKISLSKDTILYKDEFTLRDYICCFNSVYVNRKCRNFGIKNISSCFKPKDGRTFRSRRQLKRNNRYNNFFNRHKTLKAGVTTPHHKRSESLLKRNSIVHHSVHHQNRVYSSLRKSKDKLTPLMGINTQSVRIKTNINTSSKV